MVKPGRESSTGQENSFSSGGGVALVEQAGYKHGRKLSLDYFFKYSNLLLILTLSLKLLPFHFVYLIS